MLIVAVAAVAINLGLRAQPLQTALRPATTRAPVPEASIVYREGTADDQFAIATAVLREAMNPLFLQPERFLLACDETRTLGFGQLRPLSGAEGWELASLVVAPDARKRGIGSELVRRLLSRVEGEAVWLLTLESTRGFYEPLGFSVAGEGATPPLLRAERAVGSVVAGAVAGQELVCMCRGA